jgi:hypothetical protein
MAFVYRAPLERISAPPQNSTDPNVGPGIYAKPISQDVQPPSRYSYAPFSTSADRGINDKFYDIKEFTPGHYLAHTPIVISAEANKANSSFRSATARFPRPQNDDSPGPGAHNLNTSSLKLSTKKSYSAALRVGRGAIIVEPAGQPAPSIPQPQQNGYIVQDNGDLVPQFLPQRSSTPPLLLENYSARNKGTNFHSSASHRFAEKVGEGPAPNQYRPKLAQNIVSNHEVDRHSAAFASRSKRITEGGMNLSGIGEESLGPGQYDSPLNDFERIAQQKGSKSARQQCFGSKTQRQLANYIANAGAKNNSNTAEVPGPGSYQHKSSLKLSKTKQNNYFSPFSTTAKRFPVYSSAQSNASHAVLGPRDWQRELNQRAVGRNDTFLTKSERFLDNSGVLGGNQHSHIIQNSFQRENSLKLSPGPQHYSTQNLAVPSNRSIDAYRNNKFYRNKPTAVFSSSSGRFPRSEQPETASVNIDNSYSVSSQISQQNAAAFPTNSSGFASKSARFSAHKADDYHSNLGPSSYNALQSAEYLRNQGKTGKYVQNFSPAFQSVNPRLDLVGDNSNAGPGSYNIERNNFIKPSFNVTFS